MNLTLLGCSAASTCQPFRAIIVSNFFIIFDTSIRMAPLVNYFTDPYLSLFSLFRQRFAALHRFISVVLPTHQPLIHVFFPGQNFVVDNLHLLLFSIVALSRRLVLDLLSENHYTGSVGVFELDSSALAGAGLLVARRRAWWPFSLQGSLLIGGLIAVALYLCVRVVSKQTFKHSLLLLFPYAFLVVGRPLPLSSATFFFFLPCQVLRARYSSAVASGSASA